MGLQDICGSFCCCCVGIFFIFPAAVYWTGKNEKDAVCREWALESAVGAAKTLNCASHANDAAGAGLQPGDLGFLACAVDPSSFKTFSQVDFAGMNVDGLFAAGAAAAVRMNVKQWQCTETCARQECRDRRLGPAGSEGEADAQDLDEKGMPLKKTRRLGKSGSSGNSCTQVCVAWSHSRSLRDGSPVGGFQDPAGAAAVCGPNPIPGPPPVKLGFERYHANANSVRTLPAQKWAINNYQLQALPINIPMALNTWPASAQVSAATGGPTVLDRSTTFTQGNVLKTCNGATYNNMGCLEIDFEAARPKTIAMLGAIGSMPGQMSEEGWTEPGYWVCKDHSANNINAFCPNKGIGITAGGSVSEYMAKGNAACAEDITSMDQLVQVLKDANASKQWAFRAVGFIGFWLAFCLFFMPIESILENITDLFDDATDCIPGVGCCVDMLTDIFMGIVKWVLFVAGLCCASAWFLTVVVVMWFVMKPVMGACLAVVACCCCVGAGALLKTFRGGGKQGAYEDQEFDDNNE